MLVFIFVLVFVFAIRLHLHHWEKFLDVFADLHYRFLLNNLRGRRLAHKLLIQEANVGLLCISTIHQGLQVCGSTRVCDR